MKIYLKYESANDPNRNMNLIVWTLFFCESQYKCMYTVLHTAIMVCSVPTHFFICGFLYPLSMKSAGMKLKFEGTRWEVK